MLASAMTPLEAGGEMFQRRKSQPFLPVRTSLHRPLSAAATEIQDTDQEQEQDDADEALSASGSEFEEDSYSPRSSYNSFGDRSNTTVSIYDEVATPRSFYQPTFSFDDTSREAKSVEGPRGPHLFRSSQLSAELNFDTALQMSPLVALQEAQYPTPESLICRPQSVPPTTPLEPRRRPSTGIDETDLMNWSAEQVATWMYNCGFDEAIIDKFRMHDITGAVLLDMNFEDLKELDIHSFGKRHQLWTELDALRSGTDDPDAAAERRDQRSSRAKPRLNRSKSCSRTANHTKISNDREKPAEKVPVIPTNTLRRRPGRKNRRGGADDPVTPAESVSIVAIEQLLPKPHVCVRGEQCSRWRKQQRQYALAQKEQGYLTTSKDGSRFIVTGDLATACSASRTNLSESPSQRPLSEAQPSIVASSDVLGPGSMPSLDALRDFEARDPQENVQQFLTLQRIAPSTAAVIDEPATPPLELFPPLPLAQHFPTASTSAPVQSAVAAATHATATWSASTGVSASLRALPRLSIPRSASAVQYDVAPAYGSTPAPAQYGVSTLSAAASPCRTATSPFGASSSSAGMFNNALIAGVVDRYGTPASEMDIPVTAIPLGPVARNTSQSVPPNMQYRSSHASGTPLAARGVNSRHPSFALPSLAEGEVLDLESATQEYDEQQHQIVGGINRSRTHRSAHTSILANAAAASHMSNFNHDSAAATAMTTATIATTQNGVRFDERASDTQLQQETQLQRRLSRPAVATHSQQTNHLLQTQQRQQQQQLQLQQQQHQRRYSSIQHAGWMKKRRTRLLRHEWMAGHFRLSGTNLAMHKDESPHSDALSMIDVDDYTVACSGPSSTGKLAAKLKVLRITNSQSGANKDSGAGDEPAAFSFQLVPTPARSHVVHHPGGGGGGGNSSSKTSTDESGSMPRPVRSSTAPAAVGGSSSSSSSSSAKLSKQAPSKTHHFAVKSRDDRIDWMRELMLAKALRAKGEGYEVKVNGRDM